MAQGWTRTIDNLKRWMENEIPSGVKDLPMKLLAELEEGIEHALGLGKARPATENFVAMTPKIIRLVAIPTPACSHCGALMKVTHSGDGVYVVDHWGTPNDCPEAFKMWKVKASTIEFSEQVRVPQFVREAMAKNS